MVRADAQQSEARITALASARECLENARTAASEVVRSQFLYDLTLPNGPIIKGAAN
jgi:hypothetical protein